MCLYSNLPPLCATLETEVMKEEEGEEEVGEEEVGEEEWEESVVESPALAPDFSWTVLSNSDKCPEAHLVCSGRRGPLAQ